jgi:valyl-tRNA synthetase
MRQGRRLVTKLWNAARFVRVAGGGEQAEGGGDTREGGPLLRASQISHPTDRWLLSALQATIEEATARWLAYDYAGGLESAERFFWGTFCDQYLELVKGRLYDGAGAAKESAQATVAIAFDAVLKLLAPVLPHITEELYGRLCPGRGSLHTAAWPAADPALRDPAADAAGAAIVAIAGAVRRHKTARGRSLGAPLAGLSIACVDPALRARLEAAGDDLRSVSRAGGLAWADQPGDGYEPLLPGLWLRVEEQRALEEKI